MIEQPDTELEYEVQELYILAKYWLKDISFAEDELHFFKNLLKKCGDDPSVDQQKFGEKIREQEHNIANLKIAVPQFLEYLKPYIKDPKKEMDLSLLEKYNGLDDEIKILFEAVKTTKKELFSYAETVIAAR